VPEDQTVQRWNFDEYGWVDRYDEEVAGDSELYARYSEVLGAVVQLAAPRDGRRVLDIGAGTGTLAAMCVAHGAHVVGLDPSERMLARARAKPEGSASAQFICVPDPFLEIPFPDAAFDAVVTTYAFHHVPHRDKPAAVKEMLRVLRPDGIWVSGDLAFQNVAAEREALARYSWLEEEYFARIDEMRDLFAAAAASLNAEQFTPVTWVLWASL
jgi:putative AdoMet-dependent methyltransferase